MTSDKNQLFRLPLAVITVLFVLSALSMIWPGIIAVVLVLLMLLQSCGVELEVVMLSVAEVSYVPVAFSFIRRPGVVSSFT